MNAPHAAAISAAADGRVDPWHVNADLHCHSYMSDGVLAPAALVRRAHANGVQIHALTDHDEVGGIAEAAAEAARCGMQFVAGVEVSVTWGGETIHIVGLRVDTADDRLISGLARTRAGRDSRAREMAEDLERAGVPGAYEGALRYVGNPALISRTHFARHIVEQGVCADVGEVFQHFLAEGKPGFVPHRWARLAEAVEWIREAGGIAVLAHPGRYRLNATGLWALMSEFREAGGEGLGCSAVRIRVTSTDSSRSMRGSSVFAPRAAPISTRRVKAASNSGNCRNCPATSCRSGTTGRNLPRSGAVHDAALRASSGQPAAAPAPAGRAGASRWRRRCDADRCLLRARLPAR